jgi:iron complex outermembrane receptor protein
MLSLLLIGGSAMAQQRITVSGTVVDVQGEPVIGASVVEKGTTTATVTDIDGKFTLLVSSADATLVVSYLGYKAVERRAADMAGAVITMDEDRMLLDEVVVIGYGSVRKKDLTGSVNTVRAEELNRGAVTSAQEMLLGKAPGVLVTPGDGGPGSGSTIRIRGGASLNASNDPLIVIDGVPVSNDAAPGMANGLALLNPNDIESFTVLKDASATAIYGSRASNGVIMITTKKGSGKLTLNYNSTYAVNVNSKRIPTMSADEYRDFMLGLYPAGTTNGDNVRKLMGGASTDWQDLVFRPAFTTEHNISAQGSMEKEGVKMPYRVSAGYLLENGTLETSQVQNTTVGVNLSPSFLDDRLTVTLNAKGIYNANAFADGGTVNAAAFFDPTQDPHFRNADGSVDYSRTNGWFSWLSGNDPNKLANTNPMSLLYDQYDNNDAYRFLGNVTVDYKLRWLPGLRLNVNAGIDAAQAQGHKGVNPGSIQALKDDDAKGIGKYERYINNRSNEVLEMYANYVKDLGEHRVDAMAGYSWQHFYKKDDGITYFNQTDEVYNDGLPYPTEYYLLSFFGRVNYSFGGKYMATFSLRNDASSRFSKENRWGLFPSAALAWTVSEEGFLKDSRVLSMLKLRLGWGRTGQQDLGDDNYPYMARYTLSSNPSAHYLLDGEYYNVLKPLAYDYNIKWETTETYNIGIDYGFLKGRINGSLEFYFRNTYDLLSETDVPLGSNFSNRITTNVGNMENKGVELSLGAVILQGKDFSWDAGFNITYQSTEITKLALGDNPDYFVAQGDPGIGTGSRVQLHKVGYTPYTFYLYQQIYQPNGMPLQNAIVDRDEDGTITEADRYISEHKPAPDVFFGLNTKINYKNWDFGFNAHASFGNYLFNAYYAGNSTAAGNFMSQGFLVNLSNTVKQSGFTAANNSGQSFTDLFLENASFFRMDDITLGYTFNNIAGTKLGLRTAFTVQNAFIITGYSGLDPEVYGGIDSNIWPRPRIFSLRIGVTF